MMKNGKMKTAVLVLAVLFCAAGSSFALTNPFARAEKVKGENGIVTIPLSRVADGSARKFRYSDGGREITFFIVKGSDGRMHAAFDACDVCYREKKGYEQKGDAMLCRNCGQKFAVNRIGSDNAGGCNPSHLDFTVKGNSVVIRVTDLQAGGRFF